MPTEVVVTKRKVSNPLALAVLACLLEHPMHPYEMATTMRQRGKHDSIKLNYGSLYTVVDALVKRGLIVPQDTEREGKRPERTVYALTDAGRIELIDWLAELLSTPMKEYTQFEAGLCLLPALPPADAAALLLERCSRLEYEISQIRATHEFAAQRNMHRLFFIESEYRLVMKQAELEWVRRLATEIADGSFDGVDLWQLFHIELEENGSVDTDALVNRRT